MNKKKKILSIIIVAFLALTAIVGGIVLVKHNNSNSVYVYSVSEIGGGGYWGGSSRGEGYVTTENMQSVYLSDTQMPTEVFVNTGQKVKAGDKLFTFDTTLSDLELERQDINVKKLELKLKDLKNELNKINKLKPYSPVDPTPTPQPDNLEPYPLPYKLSGSGTEQDPYIYLWNDSCWFTDAFILEILTDNSSTPPAREENEPSEYLFGEIHETESVPDDTERGSEENEVPLDSQDIPENKEENQEKTVFAVFLTREHDNPKGSLIKASGLVFQRNNDGTYKFTEFDPQGDYSSTSYEENNTVIPDDSAQYSAAEIAQMRKSTQQQIKDTELQIKVERVKYERLKLEKNNGIVTAAIDGVVKTVNTADDARFNGQPFIVISAGGGYYITSSISELSLEKVAIGQSVIIESWMNPGTSEGKIVNISEFPTTSSYYYGGENPNVSYYPITIEVNEDATLQSGEYVSVQYDATETSDGIYLPTPFVIYENSKNYVYVMDNNGRLEKREVPVGRIFYGSMVELQGGISEDDYIAFPYGKNVKQGSKAEPSDLSTLYEGSYY